MKQFMDKDFLLDTDTAKHLFHDYAENMPIIDYHCHLSPKEIWEDAKFENITQVWLGGDHYKWRQMRTHGVEERYITGDASDREKFQKWAETLEMAIGNPLYHWSHLELQRYFGYYGHLCGDTAEEVWNICNEKLRTMSARQLIMDSNVKLLATTDDPADTLEYHEKIAADPTFSVKVLPAWRPEAAMNVEKPGFAAYVDRLSKAAGMDIKTYRDLMAALKIRLQYFVEHGCCISDHSLEYGHYVPASEEELETIFAKGLAGQPVTHEEELKYKTMFLVEIGREYAHLNWVMQLHMNVQRNLNEKIYNQLGADAGIDAVSTSGSAIELGQLLNALAKTDELPKTVLYSLNPADNAAIGTIMGCFQDASAVGKIQQGSAWWFNDHKSGMTDQMISYASLSLLGGFIGMLTDSRSFLSYARHEYFRRIMCNLIGNWVENGEYPNDEKALEKIVKGISYNNTLNYFAFDI